MQKSEYGMDRDGATDCLSGLRSATPAIRNPREVVFRLHSAFSQSEITNLKSSVER